MDLEKSFEAFLESTRQFEISTDSSIPQNSQIKDPYSIFQVPQQKEPTDLEISMKNLIRSGNDFTHSINKLEAQMSRLINIVKDRNEKTLPDTISTIPCHPSHIDKNEKSWCLGDLNQESILSHKLELNQFKTLDKLASFPYNEIEFECECDPNLKFL